MSTHVYVSNAGMPGESDGSVCVLRLDEARGRLEPVQTLTLGGTVMPLALDRTALRLYAGRRSEPLAAIACAIDVGSGELARLGEAALPASMAYMSIQAGGLWLLSASYPQHCIAVSRIGADGLPLPAHQVLPAGPNAHAVRAAPGGRFVFSTSLGSDTLRQWRFDGAEGRLTPNDPPVLQLPAGAGPRHFDWHPDGRRAYLLNEVDATLAVLHYDADHGLFTLGAVVSILPPGFDGKPWAADVHVRSDGRFVYASERGSSTLSVFAVDGEGPPVLVEQVAAPAQPRGFQLSVDGRWLVAAGERSNTAVLYESTARDGRLVRRDEVAVGAQPNWVELLTLA